MILPASLFALSAILAWLYVPRTQGKPSWQRSIRKTLPVGLLAAAALIENGPGPLFYAFLFSALGDWALSRPGQRAFLLGMIAFAIAHVAFIILMLPLVQTWQLGPFVLIPFGAIFLCWIAPKAGNLKWPVLFYGGVIVAMGVIAMTLPEAYRFGAIGGIVFILSDMVLAVQTFAVSENRERLHKMLGKIVWIAYASAQILLFLGLSGVGAG